MNQKIKDRETQKQQHIYRNNKINRPNGNK